MAKESTKRSRDYFAEMYVAGILADAGWNIYFPHRDVGFDMIATKVISSKTLIRPVQVKGKYATDGKLPKRAYGYVGKLTAIHPDMVLAIPYFTSSSSVAPHFIAWMLHDSIKAVKRGYACQPGSFAKTGPAMRQEFVKFFDQSGLALLEATSLALAEDG